MATKKCFKPINDEEYQYAVDKHIVYTEQVDIAEEGQEPHFIFKEWPKETPFVVLVKDNNIIKYSSDKDDEWFSGDKLLDIYVSKSEFDGEFIPGFYVGTWDYNTETEIQNFVSLSFKPKEEGEDFIFSIYENYKINEGGQIDNSYVITILSSAIHKVLFEQMDMQYPMSIKKWSTNYYSCDGINANGYVEITKEILTELKTLAGQSNKLRLKIKGIS